MTRQKLLANAIRESGGLLLRYAKGFDETNRVAQALNLPNHFAWTLGHLSLTMHRASERVDGFPLPSDDFVIADGRGGSAGKFDTESVCFNSTPRPEPGLYPTADRCLEIFDAAVERCASAFEDLPETRLDDPVKWGQSEIPTWQMAVRMVFHNGTHTGQLADLRRAMGMGSIFAS
ncbi:MAG: DinB family protein [Tepidisphaeraceae bacterium]